MIFESDPPVDFGEERIVLSKTHVESGLESTAALTDENRSACHDVAVVTLDAEPLRVAVSPVA